MNHKKSSLLKARLVPATFLLISALTISACAGDTDTNESEDTTASESDAFSMLPQDIQDDGVLTVATDASYPPCDFIDDEGQITGYNHAILMTMEPHLGVEIQQEDIQFDGLIPGVQSGRYDAAMECISDNEERREVVQFIDNAYGMNGIMTLADNPAGISENPLTMCGVSTGVQTGTNFIDNADRHSANCEQEGLPPLDVTEFPSASDVDTALESGQIEATFTSLAVARHQEAEGRAVSGFASPLIAQDYHGIVVDLENDELAKALEAALKAAVDDGSYQDAMEEWNIEELALLEPGINLDESDPIEEPDLCGACGEE